MQGTAADIIKRAMIDVDQWLSNGKTDARVIMQVHDELVLEVSGADVKKVSKKLTDIMVNAGSLSVPLEVEVGIGDNWQEAH